MMQKLLEPEAIELDPETRTAVDEVCEALSDPWGAPTGLGQRFKFALYQAAKYGSPECRQRLFAAVETAVREDPALWIQQGGICIPRTTIGQYDGRIVYETDAETGEMREVLQWPTGYFAGGNPDYARRDAA
jgi:hypothetical protein